jgi:type II secretion system protein H
VKTPGKRAERSPRPIPESRAGGRGGRAGHGRRGFTLLELVLVMVLMAIALAAVAPDLRGFYQGSRLKNGATQLVAMTDWCRTQAVTTGRVHRLNFDGSGYHVTAQDLEQYGGQFVPIGSDFGRAFLPPDQMRMTLTRDDGQAGDHVDFFPDGRTEAAVFQISRQDGRDAIRVICLTPTERFHVANENEALARR